MWRRKPFVLLLLVTLLAESGYAVLNIATMPVYLKFDRHFSEGTIALVLATFFLSEAMFKPWTGRLSDRWGRRPFVITGVSITAVSALLTIMIPAEWGVGATMAIFGLRIVDGLGAAMVWPSVFARAGDLVGPEEKQEAMSMLNLAYLLGVALAFLFGGVLNDLFGHFLRDITGSRSPGLFFAAFLFVVVAFLSRYALRVERGPSTTAAGLGIDPIAGLRIGATRIPQLMAIGMVTFMGVGFPIAIFKLFAYEQLGMRESVFGLAVGMGAVLMALVGVPAARWGERLGNIRAVHFGLALCAFGLTIIASGAFLPGMRSAWVVMIAASPVALGFLLTIPAWYATVTEMEPERRAANLGAVMTAQGVGAILAAPIGGFFYMHLQAVNPDFGRFSPFVGSATCVILAFLLSLMILRR